MQGVLERQGWPTDENMSIERDITDALVTALLEQGEELARVAMDMPLQSQEERHAYRWSDTSKATAWDIAAAIRAKVGEL